MSGEKCGSISIDDRKWKAAEVRQRRERKSLERERGKAEDKQRRLERLQRREEKRQQRLRDLAEKERQQQLVAYQARLDQFEQAGSAREGLRQQYSGIDLPDLPALPPCDQSSADSIIQASRILTDTYHDYQKQVDLAWMHWQQKEAIRQTREELRPRADPFTIHATRTVSDVLAGLNAARQILVIKQKELRLETAADKAAALVKKLPEDLDLGQTTLDALARVMQAVDVSEAQQALMALQGHVDQERQRMVELERKRQEMEQREQQAERRWEVGEAMAEVLEDLGYTVDDIKTTAFASNGRLYAIKPEWPDHAIQFSINGIGESLISEVVRVSDEKDAPMVGPADQAQMRHEDTEADTAWCGADGLIKFRKLSGERGLSLSFRREHDPGDVPLKTVFEQALGEELRQQRHASQEQEAPRARMIPR